MNKKRVSLKTISKVVMMKKSKFGLLKLFRFLTTRSKKPANIIRKSIAFKKDKTRLTDSMYLL